MIVKSLKKFLYGTLPYVRLRLFDRNNPTLPYYRFFHRHPVYTHFPYDFAQDYLGMPVEVLTEGENGLPYVLHKGKKLFFPRTYTSEHIARLYRSLLLEQDVRYPHHYVDSPDEYADRTLLDVGAAEGLISLEAVEKARHIYLFECMDEWQEALQATFRPWQDKTTLVPKYVGESTRGQTISLDDFLRDKPIEKLFLKMDIEGAECRALEGARRTFEQAEDLQFALCTYHRKNDLRDISAFLDGFRCTYAPRPGYLYVDHRMRTALLRGHKN